MPRRLRRQQWIKLYFTLGFVTVILVSFFVLFTDPNREKSPSESSGPAKYVPKLQIGDHLRFAKYNHHPILWRVVHLDGEGNPVLLSDRILTIKAYDAAGSAYNNSDRKTWGSNDYEISTLRRWLNSSDSRVTWAKNPPKKEHLFTGDNPYNQERGFLADGNFTVTERTWILPVKHRVLLSDVDNFKRTEGSGGHIEETKLADVITNERTARAHTLTDLVFLLSVKQLKEWIHDRRRILGNGYHMAKPTTFAVNQSTWKDKTLHPDKKWYYWLNTPLTSDANNVRAVFDDGTVDDLFANADTVGVRPALKLNAKIANFQKIGDGSAAKPYLTLDQ